MKEKKKINRKNALVKFTMLEEVMQTPTYKFMDAAEFYKAYIHPNRNSVPNLAANVKGALADTIT